MKVALVVMPWMPVDIPPLGVASLKACLEAGGIEADCLYLNVRMAALAGDVASVLPYQRMGSNYSWPEWFFGYHLFGPGGSGELTESLEDMFRQDWFKKLMQARGISRARAETLLERDIPVFLRDCLENIPWAHYDIIGFSSISWSHTACLKLSREIKAGFPEKPIVFGGRNVEGEMGIATLKGCDWVDYAVDGEGEEALLALAKNLKMGKPYEEIPRVSFRQGKKIFVRDAESMCPMDMNVLPTPNHDDFFKELKVSRVNRWVRPIVPFEASRGCWWGEKRQCTFCGNNGQSLSFRSKAPKLVLRDIMELHRKYKISRLLACDSILSTGNLYNLMPELKRIRRENNLDWNIHFEVKSNLTKDQVEAMAEAGVGSLVAGIESLSTPILSLMRKGVRAIQNIQMLKAATGCGILVDWNFLYGFPGEDPGEYSRMVDTISLLTHLQPPLYCGPIQVDRLSPYHVDWRSFSVRKPKPQAIYRLLYPSRRFRLEEMAYCFNFDRSNKFDGPNGYASRLRKAVDFWRKVQARNFFAFSQGMGCVELYDLRPSGLGRSLEYRELFLEGMEAFIFSFCNSVRTLRQIRHACRGYDPGCSESRIQNRIFEILAKMVKRKWMFQEDDSYLNLAVPVSSLSPAQKLVFDQFIASTLRAGASGRSET